MLIRMRCHRHGTPIVRPGQVIGALADQGAVSIGNFVVTLLLARMLAPAEYGIYSLLLIVTMGLQSIIGSLLYYPLAVRGAVLAPHDRATLFGNGFALLGALSIPLGFLVAAMLCVLGRPDLIAPAVGWFLLWQVQELVRRMLMAEMRHAAALPGDAISYLGQAAGIFWLAGAGAVTLAYSLIIMAATSGLAALLQAVQAGIRPGIAMMWPTARQCWAIGSFSLASNGLSAVRMQVFPWALAALGGTVQAANYQAATNLVMAANPILLGLCNVIPQATARGRQNAGVLQAWHAARGYILLGALPIFAYYMVLLLWPGEGLVLLYGASSPYIGLTLAVRAITIAALVAYAAEMVCSYLHGLEQAHLAMWVNMSGLAASVLLGLPLILAWGLTGGCIGLGIVSLVRCAAAAKILSPLLAHGRHPAARILRQGA